MQVEAGAEAMDLPRTSLARALLVASYHASMLLLLGLIIGHGRRAEDRWPVCLSHVRLCAAPICNSCNRQTDPDGLPWLESESPFCPK